jgi:sugar lactone lactonase YvrE
VRRYLLVFAVVALSVAAVSLFALAQGPATNAAADERAGSYAQPQNSLVGIRSASAVSIIANGIAARALTTDSAGDVYLTNAATPNRIFTLTGLANLTAESATAGSARLTLVAGTGAAGSLGDGGSALGAQFDLSTNSLVMRSGIAVAADGTIFVADTLNSTIRRIAGPDTAEPGITRSIAGRWAQPQSVKIVEPLGLAADRSGNLYVADHTLGAIDLLPNATASSPGEQQVQIVAHVAGSAELALTTDGRKLFVASPDTGAIFAIDTQTREIQPLPGFPVENANIQNDSKPVCDTSAMQSTDSTPICPSGLSVDGTGNLFVADTNSGKIVRVDAKSSAVTTVASGLRSPGAISFDKSGNLYVAEQGANRIIRFADMGDDPSNLTLTSPATLPAPPSPRVCPATAPFNFCDEPVGGYTPAQPFTLTNNTTAAVSGLMTSFTGANPADFQVSGNTCGMSLNAGASCAVNVDFAPTATGTRSAVLTVTDSAGDSATAAVSGTGDDYQLALNGSQQEEAVIQGGTLTYNFSVVPDAVFGGVVTILCPSNLPTFSTCTPSAGTVTVTPGTPVSFSVTFKTTYDGVTGGFPGNGSVPVLMLPRGRTGPPPPPIALGGLALLLAAVAILGWVRTRYRVDRKVDARFVPVRALWVLALLLATSGFVCLDGCKSSPVAPDLNTPAGSTTMIVQGSAQNAGRGVTIILDVTGRG